MIKPNNDMKTCSFVGCKHTAKVKLNHNFGDNSSTFCCDKHTPKWAKNKKTGDKSPAFGKVSFYSIEVL